MIFLIIFSLILFSASFYIFYLRDILREYGIRKKSFSINDEEILSNKFHPYKYLSDEQKILLKFKILYFLEYKNFWGLEELEVTHEMKLLIAAHACLMVLKDKALKSYSSLINIYLIPHIYIEKNGANILKTLGGRPGIKAGESWFKGPLILAWDNALSATTHWNMGQNVIYHEFGHQLDSFDGSMDGTPILKKHKDYGIWQFVMAKNFLDLKQKALHHKSSDINFYAITNEAEFFAVTVELFFAHATFFKKRHPDIYKLYENYFELDPASWK